MRSPALFLAAICLAVLPTTSFCAPDGRNTPLDARYLRDHAQTRGFTLGRPVAAKPTPDGNAVLFLRAQARVPKMELYEFNTATGQTRCLLTPEQVLKGAEEHLS